MPLLSVPPITISPSFLFLLFLATMSVLEVKNFINGEYVKAMVGDTDVPVYDPSTDTVFAHLPNSSKEDIDLAVNAAKVAFKRLETPPETPPETPLKHPETPLKHP